MFAFGDAGFHGSLSGTHLNAPVVGMVATPSGGGYWLVAADGGVFAFGDAGFHGSLVGSSLSGAIVGIARTADGGGYWIDGDNGAVYAKGDAVLHGSLAGVHLNRPVDDIVARFGGRVDRVAFYTPYLVADETVGEMVEALGHRSAETGEAGR